MLPRPGVVVCVIHVNSWNNLWAFVLKVNIGIRVKSKHEQVKLYALLGV